MLVRVQPPALNKHLTKLMLTIKTYIAAAGNKGLGLFAAEVIPIGTVWWKDDRNFNKLVSKQEVEFYPEVAKEFVYTYGSMMENGDWYIYMDNGRFVNHSDTPNTNQIENGDWVTNKEISIGEEITCNYKTFCFSCKENLPFEVI